MGDLKQASRGALALDSGVQSKPHSQVNPELSPMRRCVISSVMRRYGTTGVQTHFNALDKGLRGLGVDVEFVNSFSHYRAISYPLYAVRPMLLANTAPVWGVWWYRYWHYQFLYWSLKKRFRMKAPELVNAQCPLSADAAMRVRRECGYRYPVVLTCHFNLSQAEEFRGKGEISNSNSLYKSIVAFERKVLADVDGLAFVSQFARDHITAFLGVNHSRSVIIPNGIDSPRVRPNDVRSELEIDTDAFVITTVGTLEPRKNQMFLMDVMKRLLSVDSSFVLLLIGDGQDKHSITRIVKQAGWEKNVRLLGFRSGVRELLAASDLYCHPALMESFGIAIVEAFAARLPVIATPVGGIPEIVEHGRTGYLIAPTPDNIDAYVRQILALHQDRSLRESIAKNAYTYYAENLTSQRMAQRYLDYYAEVIAGMVRAE